MEGTMLAQMALDDPRTGALSWDCLLALVRAVRNAGTLSEVGGLEAAGPLATRFEGALVLVVIECHHT